MNVTCLMMHSLLRKKIKKTKNRKFLKKSEMHGKKTTEFLRGIFAFCSINPDFFQNVFQFLSSLIYFVRTVVGANKMFLRFCPNQMCVKRNSI